MSARRKDVNGNLLPFDEPDGAVQNVAYTATAGTSAALGATTNAVVLCATTDCYFTYGASPAAPSSTAGFYLPAKVPLTFAVTPGNKFKVVQASAAGSLSIQECQ